MKFTNTHCILGSKSLHWSRFEIPYRVFGHTGPWIVCINGVQQSMALWRCFVRQFKKDYRVLLFDLPGQGRGKILDGPLEIFLPEQVELLKALAENVIDEEPVFNIAGASWGAVLGAAYASKFPDQVHSLILGSIGVKNNKKAYELMDYGLPIFSNGQPEVAGKIIVESFAQDISPSMQQKILSQFKNLDKDTVEIFKAHLHYVREKKVISDLMDLTQITAETLLIRGENDTIVDRNDLKILNSEIKYSKVLNIPNVGHFLHLEDPSLIKLYKEFFDSALEKKFVRYAPAMKLEPVFT